MLIEEKLTTPVVYNCDVFVAGGGIGGIAAAAAAARQGKKVILAERSFMLGGLATAGLIAIYLPICDGYGRQVSFGLAEELLKLSIEVWHDEKRGYPAWIGSDITAERNEKTPRYEVNFNPQLFAISAEKFLCSLGVTILYGTYVTACVMDGDRISCAVIESKSGREAVSAAAFIEATGDCDLAKFSGAPTADCKQGNMLASWYYSYGREGCDLRVLGCFDDPEGDRKAKAKNVLNLSDRRFVGLDTKEISEFMEMSHTSIMNDVKKRRANDPEYMPVTIATMPQLRTTRHLDGEYSQGEQEMHMYFEDSIGLVSDWRKRGPVYEVPFRTLYSSKVRNLICAGRVTSVTEGMWDIMRVIPCCAVSGEAAGIASAMTDDFPTIDVTALQEKLRAAGVVIHESDLGQK